MSIIKYIHTGSVEYPAFLCYKYMVLHIISPHVQNNSENENKKLCNK